MSRVLMVVLAVSLWSCGKQETEQETVKIPSRVARGVIALDARTQARIGLETEALASAALPAEVVAYGSLQEDPARVFVVRAPVAGRLRAQAGGAWPELGRELADGAVIGAIEPRLTPVDRVSLTDRLVAARAEAQALTGSLAASRAALARAKTLNAENKNVSDRAVQEAEARVEGDDARLNAAARSAKLMESALAAGTETALTVERGGVVIEVLAQPGEAVESGQPILRAGRFDQLLARVELPAGQRAATEPASARVVLIGREDRPLRGERVSLGMTVDAKTQGQPFLFRVRAAAGDLRPGMAVAAYLGTGGAPQQGTLVPRAAIVRFGGAVWAYVEAAPGQFSRREILADRVTERGWFTTAFRAGERIVVAGAQTLLSEELKSQIQVGEEEAK